MTRKDFELIARLILAHGNNAKALAEGFAIAAQMDNPRFDRERFLAACGF